MQPKRETGHLLVWLPQTTPPLSTIKWNPTYPVASRFCRFIKTEGGVKIQEIASGSGDAVRNGDRVEIDYVLRRSNGYFIYSFLPRSGSVKRFISRTVEGVSFQPRDLPIGPIDVDVGSPNLIAGLTDALVGMKASCLCPDRIGSLPAGRRQKESAYPARSRIQK